MKKTTSRSTKSPVRKLPKRKTARQAEKGEKPSSNPGRKYELIGLAFVAIGLISLCGLFGLNVGWVGLYFAKFLHYLFGIGAVPATLVFLLVGWQYMTKHCGIHYSLRFFGLFALFASVLAIWHHIVIPEGAEILPDSLPRGGGLLGGAILFVLRKFFGVDGSIILLAIGTVGSVLLATSWSLGAGLLKTKGAAEKGATVAASAAGSVLTAAGHTAAAAGSAVEEHIAEKMDSLRQKRSFYNQEADEHFAGEPDDAHGLDAEPAPAAEAHIETVSAAEVTKVPPVSPAVSPAPEPHVDAPLPKFTIQYSSDEEPEEEPIDTGAALDAIARGQTDAELGIGVPAPGDNPSHGGYLRPTPKPDALSIAISRAMEDAGAKPRTPGAQTQVQTAEQPSEEPKIPPKPYEIPSVTEILEKSVKKKDVAMEIEIQENAEKLHKTLEDFHVSATILNACHGPAVTRYELQPAPGVKVSKITGLAEDIALALAAPSVRIEPIPGKAAIGIEVPNSKLEGVRLREVLENEKFAQAKSKLTVGLGKDIGGNAIFANLAKMPHLLVAGATGSGKSVCINTLICSILFKAKPDEVKFILVDPKMVELSNYNGIPHLMVPVVTEAKKAASVLNWSVQEMEKRYAKFAENNVRNMDTYNKKFPDDKMPAIVIIIDELADLMMVAPHDVEDAICRLAQKARAAGIHMVLATQRPSVDVITGIIKANIPSRISFAVSSQIDSRTILDRSGAENLLGKGDMLFYPVGASKPVRVQGAFISDEEVEKLLDCIKSQGQEMETNEEIVAFTEKELAAQEEEESGKGKKKRKSAMDELLPDAVDLVMSTGIASSSSLQRRFHLGYTHAARLVDTMEELGIVGPSKGSKPRDILMSQDQASKIVAQAMAGDEAAG